MFIRRDWENKTEMKNVVIKDWADWVSIEIDGEVFDEGHDIHRTQWIFLGMLLSKHKVAQIDVEYKYMMSRK